MARDKNGFVLPGQEAPSDRWAAVNYRKPPEGATELTLPVKNLKTGTYQVSLEGRKVVSKHFVIQ